MDPQHTARLVGRLTLLLQSERSAEAEALFHTILAGLPRERSAWLGLGYALHVAGALDASATLYRRALALFPPDVEVLYRLGNVERGRGDTREAIACFRHALTLQPDFWEARNNLGLALDAAGHVQEAAWQLREAIRIDASHAEVHFNLAIALTALGDLEEATVAYRAATSLSPRYAEAFNNLGAVCKTLGDLDEATTAFEAALRIRPDWAAAHSNLAGVYERQARHDEAIASHRHAIALDPGSSVIHGNLLFALLFHPRETAEGLRSEGAEWQRRHAEPLRPKFVEYGNDRNPGRRLRIGYVSAFFRDHVVGRNLLPLFREHDRSAVEVVCYSNDRTDDSITQRFRGLATLWRDITKLEDADAAALIRDDGIDILVDTTLHMEGNRLLLFARQPAPVQVTFAGYPGSTALDAIGYRLSDVHLDGPAEHDEDYAESTWCLPHTFWCYDPFDANLAVTERVINESGITFGCLNNFAKVNDGVLALWARVLAAVPGSSLSILSQRGAHRRDTVDFLQKRGVARERIEFLDPGPRQRYLELFRGLDISLDTFPYNGHTTGLDSLWMGVPVVTLVGATVVGRAGLSQLTNLGLQELVAHTPDEYVHIAAGLAADPERLLRLRRGLRARLGRSPLMDARAFASDIETAYRAMWRAWCERP